MSNPITRPQRPAIPVPLSARAGNLMVNQYQAKPITVGYVGTAPPNVVTSGIQKFAQLIMFGIAMIAIWAGLLAIALGNDERSQSEFAILGFGGLISGLMAIGLVEFQIRKGGNKLQDVHDYLLGMGFFFLAIGALWGSRWLVGFLAGPSLGMSTFGPTGNEWSESGWIPSANAIYVQMAAALVLALTQTTYLSRLEGRTNFAWAITTFTPLVLAFIGSSIWMDWSDNTVSWELGISMIALASLSMWLSLRSNSGIIFSVVAVFSGLLPLLYELNNEDSTPGGALSLLVFIIAIQGYLAADKRLRQDLMQWTSIFLVGEVVLAMIICHAADFELVLGFIRMSEYPSLEPYLTVQVALWFAVLLAYFPATLMRRIPYMPIGLAASLCIIVPQASVLPWAVTLLILPYLLVISKVTRSWVANWTFIAAAFSFLIHSNYDQGFYFDQMPFILLIGLLISGELGRQKGHLSDWAHFVALGLIVLSDTVLFGDDPYIPWVIIGYAILSSYTMMVKAKQSGEHKDAFEASAAISASMLMAVLLSIFERLEMPLPESISSQLSGFNVALAVVGLGVYFAMRNFRDTELDLGVMLSWADNQRRQFVPVYDPTVNAWVVLEPTEEQQNDTVPRGFGALGRGSLLGPLLLFTVSLSFVGMEELASNLIWTLLMVIPLGIIIAEVLGETEASSTGRMIATWMMVATSVPLAISLNMVRFEYDILANSALIFDFMLLAGPIGVSMMLSKKGLNDDMLNETSDIMTMFGLLALGLLDTSGGLLFLAMFLLVFSRALKHRLNVVLNVMPIMIIFFSTRMMYEPGLIYSIFGTMDLGEYNLAADGILGMSKFSCLIIVITNLIILGLGIVDQRLSSIENRNERPILMPAFWLSIGLFGFLPAASWLLLSLTIVFAMHSWLMGRMEIMPFIPAALWTSAIFGFGLDEGFRHWDGADIFSHSVLVAGLGAMILNQASDRGWLYRWTNEVIENPEIRVTVFNLETAAGRERMTEIMRINALICLTLSWSAFSGLGTVAGAIWATYESIVRGQKNMLLAMPALQAFAFWNMIDHLGIGVATGEFVTGAILVANSLLMTFITIKMDIPWNWKNMNWEDDAQFYKWIDFTSFAAIGYFCIGIIWAFGFGDSTSTTFWIWAIYLGAIGFQGFYGETMSSWRRGVGGFGCLISIFIVSFTYTGLMTYISWMFLGVVALGFGFAYLNLRGEDSSLFDPGYTAAMVAGPAGGMMYAPGLVQNMPNIVPVEAIAEAEIEDLSEELEDILEDVEELEEEAEEVVEEIEEAAEEVVEEIEEEAEEVVEEIEEEAEEVVEEIKRVSAHRKEVLERVEEKVAAIEKANLRILEIPKPITKETVTETPDYEIKLDPSVVHAIQTTLSATPHEGFKPVVSISPNGNLKIDFNPI